MCPPVVVVLQPTPFSRINKFFRATAILTTTMMRLFSANSMSVTINRGAVERKASGSRHIRIVFQTRPTRSACPPPLSPRSERASPRLPPAFLVLVVEPRDDREDSRPPRERSVSSSCGFSAHGCRVAVCSSSSPPPSPPPLLPPPLAPCLPLRLGLSLSFFAVLFPFASPFPSVCLLSLLRVVIPFAKLLAPGRGGEVKASAPSIANRERKRERDKLNSHANTASSPSTAVVLPSWWWQRR